MRWSEAPIRGALAVFHPRNPVALHYFTTDEGKVEIMKQANLVLHKQRYLEGWCQFVKSAKYHDGALVVMTDIVDLHYHAPDDRVVHVHPGKLTELCEADAIVAILKGLNDFRGIKVLP